MRTTNSQRRCETCVPARRRWLARACLRPAYPATAGSAVGTLAPAHGRERTVLELVVAVLAMGDQPRFPRGALLGVPPVCAADELVRSTRTGNLRKGRGQPLSFSA